jgi:predicted O-linked N-acetylglucosamine transferase (SPINDLY family)
MVTQSYQAYIDLAIKYGSNFEALDELRFDVNERVDSSSLFDCRAYCSHLEEAFQTVYRRYAAGKRPDHIIL